MATGIQSQGTINFRANTAQMDRELAQSMKRVQNFTINTSLKGNALAPLGRITGQVAELNKSLEASNARVLAFGASAGSVYLVQRAIKSLVSTTVEVQKELANINVLLRLNSGELRSFSGELFNVARGTAQSFSTVSKAAAEFSRQGLSMEETLRRTNAALLLTRLSGLDAQKSVEALTATINSFTNVTLDAVEVVNKLANVDAAFAVSSADLAEAIQRVGSSAVDAGVSFDELIALVTTAQQITARGGSVIGNSFKTIFTRLQRGKTVDLLENLGISGTDSSGQAKSMIQLLKELASVYDRLGATQRAYVAEQVGGVFQINILKAALGDLNKEYSIFDSALEKSLTTTDEAIQRNNELNQTIASLSQQAGTNIQQLATIIGNTVFEPKAKDFLKSFNSIFESFSDIDPDGFGARIGKGLLEGIANFISGPGAILIGIVGVNLFKKFLDFARGSFKELLGLNKQAKERLDLQNSLLQILQKEKGMMNELLTGQLDQGKAAQRLKQLFEDQYNILQAQQKITASLSKNLFNSGIRMVPVGSGAQTIPGPRQGKASGFIPHLSEAMGAIEHGYKPGRVFQTRIYDGKGSSQTSYVNSAEKIVNFKNSDGKRATMVVPPNGFGKNTQYASGGFVPNLAASSMLGRNQFQMKWMIEEIKKKGLPPEALNDPQIMTRLAKIFSKKYPNNQAMFNLSRGFVPNLAFPKNKKEIREGVQFERALNKAFFGIESDAGSAALDFPPPDTIGRVSAETKKQLKINPNSKFGDAKRTENKKNQQSLVSKIIRSFPEDFLNTRPDSRGFINLGASPKNSGLSMLFMEDGADKKNNANLGTLTKGVGIKTRAIIESHPSFEQGRNYTISVPYISDKVDRSILSTVSPKQKAKPIGIRANSGFIPNFAGNSSYDGNPKPNWKEFDFSDRIALVTPSGARGADRYGIQMNQIRFGGWDGSGIPGDYGINYSVYRGSANYENFAKDAEAYLVSAVDSLAQNMVGGTGIKMTGKSILEPSKLGGMTGSLFEGVLNKVFNFGGMDPNNNKVLDLPNGFPPMMARFLGIPEGSGRRGEIKKMGENRHYTAKNLIGKIANTFPDFGQMIRMMAEPLPRKKRAAPGTKKGAAAFSGFVPNFSYLEKVAQLESGMSGNKATFHTSPFPHFRNTSQPTFQSAMSDHGGLKNAIGDSVMGQKSAGLLSGGFVPNFSDEVNSSGRSGFDLGGILMALQGLMFTLLIVGRNGDEAAKSAMTLKEAFSIASKDVLDFGKKGKEAIANLQSAKEGFKSSAGYSEFRGLQKESRSQAVEISGLQSKLESKSLEDAARKELEQQLIQLKNKNVVTQQQLQAKKKSLSAEQQALVEAQKEVNIRRQAVNTLKQKAAALVKGKGFAIGSAAMILGPQVGNLLFDDKSTGGRAGQAAFSGLGNIAGLAGTGSMIAPGIGTAIGAGVGAMIEIPKVLSALSDRVPDLKRSAEEASTSFRKLSESSQGIFQAFEKIKNSDLTTEQGVKDFEKAYAAIYDNLSSARFTEGVNSKEAERLSAEFDQAIKEGDLSVASDKLSQILQVVSRISNAKILQANLAEENMDNFSSSNVAGIIFRKGLMSVDDELEKAAKKNSRRFVGGVLSFSDNSLLDDETGTRTVNPELLELSSEASRILSLIQSRNSKTDALAFLEKPLENDFKSFVEKFAEQNNLDPDELIEAFRNGGAGAFLEQIGARAESITEEVDKYNETIKKQQEATKSNNEALRQSALGLKLFGDRLSLISQRAKTFEKVFEISLKGNQSRFNSDIDFLAGEKTRPIDNRIEGVKAVQTANLDILNLLNQRDGVLNYEMRSAERNIEMDRVRGMTAVDSEFAASVQKAELDRDKFSPLSSANTAISGVAEDLFSRIEAIRSQMTPTGDQEVDKKAAESQELTRAALDRLSIGLNERLESAQFALRAGVVNTNIRDPEALVRETGEGFLAQVKAERDALPETEREGSPLSALINSLEGNLNDPTVTGGELESLFNKITASFESSQSEAAETAKQAIEDAKNKATQERKKIEEVSKQQLVMLRVNNSLAKARQLIETKLNRGGSIESQIERGGNKEVQEVVDNLNEITAVGFNEAARKDFLKGKKGVSEETGSTFIRSQMGLQKVFGFSRLDQGSDDFKVAEKIIKEKLLRSFDQIEETGGLSTRQKDELAKMRAEVEKGGTLSPQTLKALYALGKTDEANFAVDQAIATAREEGDFDLVRQLETLKNENMDPVVRSVESFHESFKTFAGREGQSNASELRQFASEAEEKIKQKKRDFQMESVASNYSPEVQKVIEKVFDQLGDQISGISEDLRQNFSFYSEGKFRNIENINPAMETKGGDFVISEANGMGLTPDMPVISNDDYRVTKQRRVPTAEDNRLNANTIIDEAREDLAQEERDISRQISSLYNNLKDLDQEVAKLEIDKERAETAYKTGGDPLDKSRADVAGYNLRLKTEERDALEKNMFGTNSSTGPNGGEIQELNNTLKDLQNQRRELDSVKVTELLVSATSSIQNEIAQGIASGFSEQNWGKVLAESESSATDVDEAGWGKVIENLESASNLLVAGAENWGKVENVDFDSNAFLELDTSITSSSEALSLFKSALDGSLTSLEKIKNFVLEAPSPKSAEESSAPVNQNITMQITINNEGNGQIDESALGQLRAEFTARLQDLSRGRVTPPRSLVA